MRAIVVELAGADDRDSVEGRARDADTDADGGPVGRGTGQLTARTGTPAAPASNEGEPA